MQENKKKPLTGVVPYQCARRGIEESLRCHV
jgi:hypothetical protein